MGAAGNRTLILRIISITNYHSATEADDSREKVLVLFTTYKHTVYENVFVENRVRATLLIISRFVYSRSALEIYKRRD